MNPSSTKSKQSQQPPFTGFDAFAKVAPAANVDCVFEEDADSQADPVPARLSQTRIVALLTGSNLRRQRTIQLAGIQDRHERSIAALVDHGIGIDRGLLQDAATAVASARLQRQQQYRQEHDRTDDPTVSSSDRDKKDTHDPLKVGIRQSYQRATTARLLLPAP